jgi:pyruvyltransferase
MRKIKVYSASVGKRFGETPENFGDNLMHHLLRELYHLDVEYVRHAEAELIGIGSILDAHFRKRGGRPVSWLRRRPWRTLHVWGSGFMSSNSQASWPQSVKFHAVRGPLTRRRVASEGQQESVALGDPGLLLPQIWPAALGKNCKVLVIPHFATHKTFMAKYAQSLPKYWDVLDLLASPQAICEKIAGADMVVSSSLHGIIVADAYKVPSCWMEPHGKIKGDGFKFEDYAAQRGRALNTPVDFEDVLKGSVDLDDERFAAQPPTDEVITRLIDSFPFK